MGGFYDLFETDFLSSAWSVVDGIVFAHPFPLLYPAIELATICHPVGGHHLANHVDGGDERLVRFAERERERDARVCGQAESGVCLFECLAYFRWWEG